MGLPAPLRAALPDALGLLTRPTCPLAIPPKLPGAVWVDPRLTLRVRFQARTADGLLRAPLGVAVQLTDQAPSGVS